MKAIVMTGYGDVGVLEERELPEPKVGPGDVKIRTAAAGLNPVDWKIRRGDMRALRKIELPFVLGSDASGEVVEVGRDVTAFRPGDRVLGFVSGGYAERVVAPASSWARVPQGLDVRDAAALPVVCLTGAQLMEEGVKPARGAVVLVTGAVGGVGRAAVFAAKARGAVVWAGVRASQKDEAAKLGVAGVVALDDAADVARLPPLDAIADTVDGATLAALLPKVKQGGTVGSVLGEPAGAKERGLTARGVVSHPDTARLAQLAEAVARGELVIPIAARFPFARVREAQTLVERGANGKVLLTA